MTERMTKNTIRKSYDNIIEVGYAELPWFLEYTKKIGYNAGVYGWNWDAYKLDYNTCIVTGYRNTLGQKIDRKYIQKIDQRARKIFNENWQYEVRKQLLEELKEEFLENYKNHLI